MSAVVADILVDSLEGLLHGISVPLRAAEGLENEEIMDAVAHLCSRISAEVDAKILPLVYRHFPDAKPTSRTSG